MLHVYKAGPSPLFPVEDRDIVPVFDGVWILLTDMFGGYYVKLCAIHGPEVTPTYAFPSPYEMREHALTAVLITSACAARDLNEFKSFIRKFVPPEDEDFHYTPRKSYKRTARWLARTLGTSREDVLRSLKRIASCKEMPAEYEAAVAVSYGAGAELCGRAAADKYCSPALLLLTDSCAEHSVLSEALVEALNRTQTRLETKLYGEGVRMPDWKAAAAYTRTFLEVLRNRSRYALL